MIARTVAFTLFAAGIAMGGGGRGHAADTLAERFALPNRDSGAGFFMNWPNGNVTREGIAREMAALGGMPIHGFDVDDRANDRMAQGPAACLGPEWDARMVDKAREAHANEIVAGVHLCPGFSSAGGPWVTPDLSMRILRFTSIRVEGGKTVSIALPKPEGADYRDIKVLAYPSPDAPLSRRGATFCTSAGQTGALDPATVIEFAVGKGAAKAKPAATEASELVIDAREPFTARTLQINCIRSVNLEIQASEDGKDWRTVASYAEAESDGKNHNNRAPLDKLRIPIPATTARFFRVVFDGAGAGRPAPPQKRSASVPSLSGLDLLSESSVDHFPAKGMYLYPYEFLPALPPESAADPAIDPGSVIDLTGRMKPDGSLSWDAPPGAWAIVRLGHVSTESTNHPAVEGKGLECDKLNAKAVRYHFDSYIRRIHDLSRKAGSEPFKVVHLDSFEAGTQNWTPAMLDEFTSRRGYDPSPWLLALTGRVVGSREASDRFLADFRRCISDLALDNYFSLITSLAHELGMTTSVQIYGNSTNEIWDVLQAAGRVDSAENEFWGMSGQGRPGQFFVEARVVGIPDAAHVYGLKICSAEAWTSGIDFRRSPRDYKVRGDYNWTRGVNRISPHGTVHQPWPDARPGFVANSWGPGFHHTQSWWPLSEGWWNYVARAQSLLQSGDHRADILYFMGDDVPMRLNSRYPRVPAGYRLDACPAEIVMERLQVDPADGDLVLPQGQRYRMLLLPPEDAMRPAVARKLEELVKAGGTIAGSKPVRSNHLTGNPEEANAEVRRIADLLWGDGSEAIRKLGKGKVLRAWDLAAVREQWRTEGIRKHHTVNWLPVAGLEEALGTLAVKPDIEGSTGDTDVAWIRRETRADSIYGLSNQSGKSGERVLTFRQTTRIPEIWNPLDGSMERAAFVRTADGRTAVTLNLDAGQMLFVVFRDTPTAPTVSRQPSGAPIQLEGPWSVAFEKNLGAPEQITLDKLAPLHTRSEPGVKYFSGIATYRQVLNLTESQIRTLKSHIILDLGEVHDIARVSINGRTVANLWCPPYRREIPASAFKSGENELRVEVAIPWANRLIGDEQLPPDAPRQVLKGKTESHTEVPEWVKSGGRSPNGRVTFASETTEGALKGDPLQPSGLVGPVTLQPMVVTQ